MSNVAEAADCYHMELEIVELGSKVPPADLRVDMTDLCSPHRPP